MIMTLENKPSTLEEAWSRIRQYAEENRLTPTEVCDMFSVGIAAKSILRLFPEAELLGQ